MLNYLKVIPNFKIGVIEFAGGIPYSLEQIGNLILKEKDGFLLLDFSNFSYINSKEYSEAIEVIRKTPQNLIEKKVGKDIIDTFFVSFRKVIENKEKIPESLKKLESFLKNNPPKPIKKKIDLLIKKHNIQDIEFLYKLLVHEWVGFSFLTIFMEDQNIEEIYIGTQEIKDPIIMFDHRELGRVFTNLSFRGYEEFFVFASKSAGFLGRSISESNPLVNTQIPFGRGGRAQITLKPVALENYGYANIRLFPRTAFSPKKLSKWKSLPSLILPFFIALFETKGNIIISGETGSGKTTLLNSLLVFIPPSLRIITVEETPELILTGFPHVVKEVATENVTLYDIISASLRQTPQVYILGEIRTKEEIQGFLRTTSSGQANISLATFHASSIEGLIERFRKEANASIPQLRTINVLVFQNKLNVTKNGKDFILRRVTGVFERIEPNEEVLQLIEESCLKTYKKPLEDLLKYLSSIEINVSDEMVSSLGNTIIKKGPSIKIIKIEDEILYYLKWIEYNLLDDTFIYFINNIKYSSVMKAFMRKIKVKDVDSFITKLNNLLTKVNGITSEKFDEYLKKWITIRREVMQKI